MYGARSCGGRGLALALPPDTPLGARHWVRAIEGHGWKGARMQEGHILKSLTITRAPPASLALVLSLFALEAVIARAHAGEADVVRASAREAPNGTWTLSATVRHDDEGWDHYADQWIASTPEGDIVATRILAHPHVDEQPFTRALSGVVIDPSVTTLVFRARDSVHGIGGAAVTITLARR